jgi:hypothetical protein
MASMASWLLRSHKFVFSMKDVASMPILPSVHRRMVRLVVEKFTTKRVSTD